MNVPTPHRRQSLCQRTVRADDSRHRRTGTTQKLRREKKGPTIETEEKPLPGYYPHHDHSGHPEPVRRRGANGSTTNAWSRFATNSTHILDTPFFHGRRFLSCIGSSKLKVSRELPRPHVTIRRDPGWRKSWRTTNRETCSSIRSEYWKSTMAVRSCFVPATPSVPQPLPRNHGRHRRCEATLS